MNLYASMINDAVMYLFHNGITLSLGEASSLGKALSLFEASCLGLSLEFGAKPRAWARLSPKPKGKG